MNKKFYLLILFIPLFFASCSLSDPQSTQIMEEALPNKPDRWMLYEDALAARMLSLPQQRGIYGE